jgi:hypothetical protein
MAIRTPQQQKTDIEIAKEVATFFDDPMGFVMFAFPWDTDQSIQIVELEEPWASRYDSKYGPDRWACEFLDEWGEAIKKNGFDPHNPVAVPAYQAAVSSGHGIGKSTLTSWIILFIASTRPHSKGVVTANTSDQLKTKTWGELGKWSKKCITGHWFEYNNGKGNMNLYHKDHKETWRCDGQTCREENSESFAGLHAANSSPYYIFDEASAVPDTIWEVAEGGLTDGEPFWFAFGNPTRNTGRFRECFRKFRKRWRTRHIDSRSVAITNKEKIQEWIDDYGEDSDFVKVRVRGVFPHMSIKQFIGEDLVEAARGRHLTKRQYEFAPRIITCDPAWEGDDELVIAMRQGLAFEILKVIPKNDNDVEIANLIAFYEDKYKADGVIIDMGYGTGIYSAGVTMGRDWLLVAFGGASPEPGYLNMRAYMYGQAKKWLQAGGAIPDDDDLCFELCAPETVPRFDGIIQLESKKDLKKRKIPSGNRADSLIISFAHQIAKKQDHQGEAEMCEMDYEPVN